MRMMMYSDNYKFEPRQCSECPRMITNRHWHAKRCHNCHKKAWRKKQEAEQRRMDEAVIERKMKAPASTLTYDSRQWKVRPYGTLRNIWE